jgi:hypothetical protein
VAIVPAVAVAFAIDDRTGADDAHLAAQDIEQLRKLVDARLAQKRADRGDARIVAQLMVTLPLGTCGEIGFQQLAEHLLRVDDHGAELEAAKGLSGASKPPVREEDRARIGNRDQQHDQHEHGSKKKKSTAREDKVGRTGERSCHTLLRDRTLQGLFG